MSEPLENGSNSLLDYVQSIASPLFGISSQDFHSLLTTTEETRYALSKFVTDGEVMALYVEWLRKEGSTGK
mgnify:CR=1